MGGELEKAAAKCGEIHPPHARFPRGLRWFFLVGRQKYPFILPLRVRLLFGNDLYLRYHK